MWEAAAPGNVQTKEKVYSKNLKWFFFFFYFLGFFFTIFLIKPPWHRAWLTASPQTEVKYGIQTRKWLIDLPWKKINVCWLCSTPVWAFSFLVEQSEPASPNEATEAHEHGMHTRPEPALANHTQHPRRPPTAAESSSRTPTTRLPSLPWRSSRHSGEETEVANENSGRDGVEATAYHSLPSRATKVTTGSALAQDSFITTGDCTICKTLPDHICLIMISHFYLVLYSSQRATACTRISESLNNPSKPGGAGTDCTGCVLFLRETLSSSTLCVWVSSASMYGGSGPVLRAGGEMETYRREKTRGSQMCTPAVFSLLIT